MIRKRQYKKSPPKYFMLLTLERKQLKVGIRGKDDSFKKGQCYGFGRLQFFIGQGRNFEVVRSHNENYEQNKLNGACR